MCKVLGIRWGKNVTPAEKMRFAFVAGALLATDNPDGFGLVTDTMIEHKTLAFDPTIIQEAASDIRRSKVLFMHGRVRTCGAVSFENVQPLVHKKNGVILLHNGVLDSWELDTGTTEEGNRNSGYSGEYAYSGGKKKYKGNVYKYDFHESQTGYMKNGTLFGKSDTKQFFDELAVSPLLFYDKIRNWNNSGWAAFLYYDKTRDIITAWRSDVWAKLEMVQFKNGTQLMTTKEYDLAVLESATGWGRKCYWSLGTDEIWELRSDLIWRIPYFELPYEEKTNKKGKGKKRHHRNHHTVGKRDSEKGQKVIRY